MVPEVAYTVARAARRAGVSEATIWSWIKAGTIEVLPDASPMQVRTRKIEEERARRLAKFDDVLDITIGAPPLPASPVSQQDKSDTIVGLRERIATLESQLRQVISSQALLNEGLEDQFRGYEKQLKGQQGLMDAVLSTLSVEQP